MKVCQLDDLLGLLIQLQCNKKTNIPCKSTDNNYLMCIWTIIQFEEQKLI